MALRSETVGEPLQKRASDTYPVSTNFHDTFFVRTNFHKSSPQPFCAAAS